MGVAVVIERIRVALDNGKLSEVASETRFKPLLTMGDLLQSWYDVFPGMELPEEGEDVHELRESRAGGVKCRPKFTPYPKRSARPLPPPRALLPTPKLVHPGLFRSISAIWEWYGIRGHADDGLLLQPFSDEGFFKFTDHLTTVLSDYYPLGCELENLVEHVTDMGTLCLRLPVYSYDDEGSGVIQAFCEGADGIAWLMANFSKTHEWDLPKSDRKLIEEHGWKLLANAYANFAGKKCYDLGKLEDTETSYFHEVKARWPERLDHGVVIIDDGWGDSVDINAPEDIEFALTFAEAWNGMECDLPSGTEFENNEGGVVAEFAHEICNVWRKVHGKRTVKWQSSNRTMVNV